MKTVSASAIGREQAALIRQGWIVRITIIVVCAILLPVLSYSLVQNHRITRLKVSGVTTSARVTKTDHLFGVWRGHPSYGTIVVFKYADASGKTYEGWEKISGFSASKLNPGDEFPAWYDRARPNRFLTPWTDNSIEIRITSFIVLLLAALVAVFIVTRPRIKPVKTL
ncbi:MAG TPA: DUF3592 domain-containing protein [Candidatus Udaeobacter sp.]|nr:DUF3592 domain-containing protein [Candidatus Udaeobacter sp.]